MAMTSAINRPQITAAVVVLALWAAAPAFATRGVVDTLVFTGLYTIAGLGVSFLLGQCGIVSLAQSVFYGIGAYTSAYCATQLGWSAPAGFAIGIAISAAIATMVGWPILRLSGYFLALASSSRRFGTCAAKRSTALPCTITLTCPLFLTLRTRCVDWPESR